MNERDLHPLRFNADKTEILPFLKICCRKKPNFRQSLRKAVMKDMKIKIPETEKDIALEPFLQLGYGVNSYFDILKMIGFLFFLISLAMIPAMYIYSHNTMIGLKHELTGFKFATQQFTLGNMGGADTTCQSASVDRGNMKLSCTNGESAVMDSNSFTFGVISNKVGDSTFCTNTPIKEKFNAMRDAPTFDLCTDSLNKDFLRGRFEKQCHGKGKCDFHFDDINEFYTDPKEVDLEQCGGNAQFFIQYHCYVDYASNGPRQVFGLLAACISVFVYFFIVVYIDYIQCVQITKFVDFDTKTITASDYTLEFDIHEEVYHQFKEREYFDETNPIGEIAQFKLYI